MKRLLIACTLLLGSTVAFCADSSEAGVKTSPLKIYGGGLAFGAVAAVNDELRNDVAEQFFKLTFSNTVYYREYINLFLDFDWFAPGYNLGADMGIDFLFSKSEFKPFFGIGVGANYFDRENGNFGDNIGPSATAHFGFSLDITESMQARFRIPFTVALNNYRDNTAGLEVGFIFSSPFKKVKKLNYN